jgi:hypothetical protein
VIDIPFEKNAGTISGALPNNEWLFFMILFQLPADYFRQI